MTSELDRSRGDRARATAYLKDFLPGILGYCLVVVLVTVFGDMDGTSNWRYLWAVLPVIPLLWVARAVVRHLGRSDEYQRRIVLQGMATGFAVAMITAVTVGLLAIAGLDGRLAAWTVFGAGMVGWAVGSAVATRR